MKKHKICCAAVLCFMLMSCSLFDKTGSEARNFFIMDDIEPPVLMEVQSVAPDKVRLVFDEEIIPYPDSFYPNEIIAEKYSVLVTLTESIKAGTTVMLEGRVKDKGGNSTGIETPVWGYNADLPEVGINEFSTRGEGNNPDRTELKVLRGGNMGGVVLYNGIPDSWDSRIIFEPFEVKAGDYIVVWWTVELPSGLKKEQGIINICAGTDVNLPGYNGILTLTKTPARGTEVFDCVVYSNNSATYGGFGSKTTQERVNAAVDNGWWKNLALDSSENTATRTFCKNPDDGTWYICTTKGSSFGYENTSSPYSAD